MKKIFNILALMLFIGSSAFAQLDRSIIPTAGEATKLDFGKSTTFELKNGLKVILVEDHRFPKVSFSLQLDVDPIYEGDKAGVTAYAGQLMRMGTESSTKAEIDERIDFIAGALSTSRNGVAVSGLVRNTDDLLDIMCEVLYEPTFPAEELEKLKKQDLEGVKLGKEDMSAIESNVRTALMYGKETAYGEIQTEETIKNITVEDCKDYYNTYFQPKGSYLIVMGDISKKEVKKIAKARFADWEPKQVPEHAFQYPAPIEKPVYAVANKSGSTQASISVSYPVNLKPDAEDIMAVRVMNQILGGGGFSARLFSNLREDKGWTYGSYSSISSNEYLGSFRAFANVRVNVVDSALTEIAYEMDRMQDELVDEDLLQLVKNALAGSFGRSLENSSTIAGFAYNIDKYNLPEDYYETYMERLEAVTAEDVQAMAKKYLKSENAIYLAVGDIATVAPLMEKLADGAKVTEYDYYANVVERSTVPAGLTAMAVVDNYIDAIGGKEALESVASIQEEAQTEIQGQLLKIKTVQVAPDKVYLGTYLGDKLMSKQIYNGEVAKLVMNGQEQVLEAPMAAKMAEQAVIFPALYYAADELTLVGMDKVDDVPVYVLKKDNETMFFDTKTGLLLKSVSAQGDAVSTVTYADYKEFDGVMKPTSTTRTQAGRAMVFKTTSIIINDEIDESIFD